MNIKDIVKEVAGKAPGTSIVVGEYVIRKFP